MKKWTNRAQMKEPHDLAYKNRQEAQQPRPDTKRQRHHNQNSVAN